MTDNRHAYDYANSTAEELASVELVLPDPPARTNGDDDFLNRLLDAAGPLGWRWSALAIKRPKHTGRDDVAEAQRPVYDKLLKLIDKAERLRSDMEDGSLTVEDLHADCMEIEDEGRRLEREADALPYSTDEEDE